MLVTTPVGLALFLLPLLMGSGASESQKKKSQKCSIQTDQGFQKTRKVMGYYPSYNWKFQSPKDLNYEIYTDVLFFVAVPHPDYTFIFEDMKGGNGTEMALTFAKEAKSHNVTPLLSFGGWTGSRFFSTLTSSKSSRNRFAFEMVKFTKMLGYSGIDIDWEYPNSEGIGCNSKNANDLRNLGLLVKEIRRLWPTAQLTAAVGLSGLVGPSGDPATADDTKTLVKNLDYVNIMAYDVNGAWRPDTGPLAPISAKCSPPDNAFSVETGLQTFIKQGFKASQLLLGIPAYGVGFGLADPTLKVKKVNGIDTYYYQKTSGVTTPGGISDDQPSVDVCGNQQGYGGIWLVKELINNGWLSQDQLASGKGFTRYFDQCSGMPFITNKKLLISYDDKYSTVKKAEFAKSHGMAGVFFFDTEGAPDSTIKAAREALEHHS